MQAWKQTEQERGSAVVANEIRNLAGQSKFSVAKISNILNGLVNNSKSSVEVMINISNGIADQDDKLKSTNEVLGNIIKLSTVPEENV